MHAVCCVQVVETSFPSDAPSRNSTELEAITQETEEALEGLPAKLFDCILDGLRSVLRVVSNANVMVAAVPPLERAPLILSDPTGLNFTERTGTRVMMIVMTMAMKIDEGGGGDGAADKPSFPLSTCLLILLLQWSL